MPGPEANGMQATVVPGVSMWSAWQSERGMYFNSFFFERDGGNVAVDPLPLDDVDAGEIERRGGLAWIVVTNRDHERGSHALAARFGAKIATSALDAPLLSAPADRLLEDGDEIAGARVVMFAGLKTPGEFGLHFPHLRTALVGDALWGNPAGSLRLMPDEKLADPARAAFSLRELAALDFEHLLLGDGACIFGGAKRVLRQYLAARRDAYANAVNRDEMTFVRGEYPGAFGLQSRCDVGALIGAEKLGYAIDVLEPGAVSCPMHWHAVEEELFVVMRGRATLVTPRGKTALREGDYVSFPVGPDHAHKVVNDSNERCEILMIANFGNLTDVCFYPESNKLLIEASDQILRDHPTLDYFDGEATL